jgi:4-aminobutyrate aminotransferase-like enzyme
MENSKIRYRVVERMRSRGVLINGCGENTIRLRPMLIYDYEQVHQFLEEFYTVIDDL